MHIIYQSYHFGVSLCVIVVLWQEGHHVSIRDTHHRHTEAIQSPITVLLGVAMLQHSKLHMVLLDTCLAPF